MAGLLLLVLLGSGLQAAGDAPGIEHLAGAASQELPEPASETGVASEPDVALANLTATPGPGPGEITLSWSAIPGAQGYSIYRWNGTGWPLIYETWAPGFVDRHKLAGQNYSYRVTAMDGENAPLEASAPGSMEEVPCERTFDDYLEDNRAYNYLIVADPEFDPAKEYGWSPGSYVVWSPRDWDCVFPPEELEHNAEDWEDDPDNGADGSSSAE